MPESEIRSQLARILASNTFMKSERLAAFLRFVVERTIDGNAGTLKEQVLVTELYGRGPDFDTRADPIVRVDARRLRDKLREYYAEHPEDRVIITIPKGAYAPRFEANAAQTVDHLTAPEIQVSRRPARARMAALAAAIVVITTIGLWLGVPRQQSLPPRLSPLTAYPGNEGQASLSPDGKFVAFACTPAAAAAHADICVKAVGAEVVQRITDTPEAEYWPAWSPDASQIVFGRGPGGSAPAYEDFGQELGIFVTSRMGGPVRRVSDTGAIAKWRPDGKALLIRDRLNATDSYGIFEFDLTTSQRRRVTQPRQGAGDWLFDVSPDGKRLAFIRVGRPGIADVYVVPLAGGEPRRITEWNRHISGIAWMPDNKELVYTLEGQIWRVAADTDRPAAGSPIPNIPMHAAGVSVSRAIPGLPTRLVFGNPKPRVNLHRVDLTSADESGQLRRILPFAPATRFNSPGRFSPDGSKVSFVSDRSSADMELWIANSDGSGARQVTTLGSTRGMLAGAWSPDGKRILFDTAINGNHDVYAVSSDGGEPVRLTTRSGLDLLADWSKDGRWVYYSSEDTGAAQGSNLWRIPSEGGPAEQITTAGGFDPQVAPGGDYLYYLDRSPLAGKGHIMRKRVGGGEPERVISNVAPFLWCVTQNGIYFVRQEEQVHSVHLYRFEDQKTARVGLLSVRLAGLQAPGRLTVSPDGRWALVNVSEPAEGDLMLLDNFS